MEPNYQDMSDIEEGKIRSHCLYCKHRLIKVVKVVVRESDKGFSYMLKTKNFLGRCDNPECFHFWDIQKSPSWVPVDTVLPDMQSQLRKAESVV